MNYWIFGLPIIAGLLTQAIKVIVEGFKNKFSWNLFSKYGGMPSSHSAFVFGLLAEIVSIDGIYSTTFATALILTILIVRDATGFRRLMDSQAKAINKLTEKLPADKQNDINHLPENIGHTPLQITIGALLGVAIVILGNLILTK
ncbi:MAG: divergent PAP2 family protein [Patescibacteria group bacterium]|jgi:hypothetical protein